MIILKVMSAHKKMKLLQIILIIGVIKIWRGFKFKKAGIVEINTANNVFYISLPNNSSIWNRKLMSDYRFFWLENDRGFFRENI